MNDLGAVSAPIGGLTDVRWFTSQEAADLHAFAEIVLAPERAVEVGYEGVGAGIFAILAADECRDQRAAGAAGCYLRSLLHRVEAISVKASPYDAGVVGYLRELRMKRGTQFFERFDGADLQARPDVELEQNVLRLAFTLRAAFPIESEPNVTPDTGGSLFDGSDGELEAAG